MLILSLMKQKNHNFFLNDFQSLNVDWHVGMELFVRISTLKVGNANCGRKYYAITKWKYNTEIKRGMFSYLP
jgi:hypothetical protein